MSAGSAMLKGPLISESVWDVVYGRVPFRVTHAILHVGAVRIGIPLKTGPRLVEAGQRAEGPST